MNITWLIVVLLLVGTTSLCCDGGQRQVRKHSSPIVRRETADHQPKVRFGPDDKKTLIADIARFGVALFIRGDWNINAVSSPLGISRVLAMVYAGAAGETLHQMKGVLGPDLESETYHRAMASIAHDLKPFESFSGQNAVRKRADIKLTQSVWLRSDITQKPSYLSALRAHYDTTAKSINFLNPAKTVDAINRWFAEQTKGKFENLINRGDVRPDLTLLLASVVRFESQWAQPFPLNATQSRDFIRLDSSPVKVSMMHTKRKLPYAAGDGFEMVDIPYAGNVFMMRVVVPTKSRFFEVLTRLREKDTDLLDGATKPYELCFTMPKFRFSANISLTESLVQLGLNDAFHSGIADFSSIDGSKTLSISQVMERSHVAIDELGTEASSAAVGMIVRSAKSECPKELIVDRPFIFLIRDNHGLLVFLGRVTDPSV